MWRKTSALALATAATCVLAGAAPPATAASSDDVVDTAVPAGVYQVSESWASNTVDVNGDGFDDLFLGGHDRGAVLMVNNQDGTFTRPAAS